MFFNRGPKKKVFAINGMEITLTTDFQAFRQEPYTAAFASEGVAIFALKEPFALLSGSENYTLEQYRDLTIQENAKQHKVMKPAEKYGPNCLEHAFIDLDDPNAKPYHYVLYLYKAKDAFWTIQFATGAEKSFFYADAIKGWAKTIRFT